MAVYRSRMVVLPVLSQMRLVTAGNAWTSPEYTELHVPDFTHLLPTAEEITLVTLDENPTTNMRWGLFFYSGFDRSHENALVQIGSDVSAAGSLRHSAYATVGNFLLESRLVVGMGNNAGSVLRECATVSAALLIKTVGM